MSAAEEIPGPATAKREYLKTGQGILVLLLKIKKTRSGCFANGQRLARVLILGIWKLCSTLGSIEPSSTVLNEGRLPL